MYLTLVCCDAVQEPLLQQPKRSCQQTACSDLTFPKTSTLDFLDQYDSSCWCDVEVSVGEACDIEKATTGQSNCDLWGKLRCQRITASHMPQILKRKAPVSLQFLRSIFTPKAFHTTATTYGLANEKTAKQQYLHHFPSHHFHDIGLIINPLFPFLAATPDARVCTELDTVIAEIKCPYSARDMTVEEACHQLQTFCLSYDENGCHLKHSHDYWYQIQGQLLVTGAPRCIFILFTHKSLHTEIIMPCKTTAQSMFDTLFNFYTQHGLHYLRSLSISDTGSLELTVYEDGDR